jgi:hypothetical protein
MDPLERFKSRDPMKIRADERIAKILKNHPEPFNKILANAMITMVKVQPTYIMALLMESYARKQGDELTELHYGFASAHTAEDERVDFASLIYYSSREPSSKEPLVDLLNIPNAYYTYAKTFSEKMPHPIGFLISVVGNEVMKAGWFAASVDSSDEKMIYAGWDSDGFVEGKSKARTAPNKVLKVEFFNPKHPLKLAVLHLNYGPLLKEIPKQVSA